MSAPGRRGAQNRTSQGSRSRVKDPKVRFRSDAEIHKLVQSLKSGRQWRSLYKAEAKRLVDEGYEYNLATYMEDFCKRALRIRQHQMRNDDDRIESIAKQALIGLIPMGRLAFSWRDPCGSFSAISKANLGLEDTNLLNRMNIEVRKAVKSAKESEMKHKCIKFCLGRLWDVSDMGEEIQAMLIEFLVRELGEATASNLAAEALHLRPVIGQCVSAGISAISQKRKTKAIIKALGKIADEIHCEVYLPSVLINIA